MTTAGLGPVDLTTEALVELDGVSRQFPGSPPVAALSGVDLHLAAGEYLSIVGPSGSGKSTLLNVLGCLDTPTSGRYLLAGADVAALGEGARAELRGDVIGFVFQSFHLLPYRTALENVMLAEVYGRGPRRGRRARAEEQLERVGLASRRHHRPTEMSGGERQRVAIARALLGRPRLLLCDEPTGALDSENTGVVLDLFDDLHAEGLALAVITHDETVSRRAQRQVRIRDGRLDEPAVPAQRPQP